MDTVLTIRLDDDLLRSVDAAAARAQVSRSGLIREILRTSLQRRSASAYEALAPFAGIVDGPADLSTNPRHLKGMGRKPAPR